jgi:hypothetical protein
MISTVVVRDAMATSSFRVRPPYDVTVIVDTTVFTGRGPSSASRADPTLQLMPMFIPFITRRH